LNSLRFAFVACNKNPQRFMQDPSFIYRCDNLALALRSQGHQTTLLHYTQLSGNAQYDVVIFHRPNYRFGFNWKIKQLQKNGTVTIADVDDLIFHTDWAAVSPGVVNPLVSFKQTEKYFAANAKALAAFKYLTTSTLPLAEKLSQQLPDAKVLLVPNTVHISWYQQEKVDNLESAESAESPRLTYFPGTRSHDRDFATIAAPLAEFLHQYPAIELHITGVLDCTLSCRPGQLVQHQKQPFSQYSQHVSRSWVNLAPLEATEFNWHKSALKAIEASYFNSPTLATPIPDMQRLAHCGAILVTSENDWFSQLSNLTTPSYYQQHSAQLRQRLLTTDCIEQQAERLLQFVTTL
jgi:hypothetical protein